ncbi:MAG TPA: hypothetical protein VF070_21635 [Streptosporangiaceae bacterium]
MREDFQALAVAFQVSPGERATEVMGLVIRKSTTALVSQGRQAEELNSPAGLYL